jgi:hypothetical protein
VGGTLAADLPAVKAKSGGGGQRTEDRGQRIEVRGQRIEVRGQRSEEAN